MDLVVWFFLEASLHGCVPCNLNSYRPLGTTLLKEHTLLVPSQSAPEDYDRTHRATQWEDFCLYP
jgi:hypothetical protein